MKLHKLKWAAAATSVLLLFAACADGGNRAGEGGNDGGGGGEKQEITEGIINRNEDPGDPASGGTVTFASYTEPRLLDPAMTQATGSTGGTEMIAIYDTLLRYDWEKQELAPQLAEGFEVNDDSTEFTLTLREGVTFSDGEKLDAAAVKASMERYAKSQRAPDGRLWNANVASVEAPDERTVVIKLREPYATFGNLLASGPGMIVSPKAGDGENFRPIGAGPFIVETLKPREATEMKANPDYWDGKPNLDKLRFAYLGTPQAGVDALLSGDVDAALLREPNRVDAALKDKREAYINYVSASNVLMFSTVEGRPGQDPRVRKAIALAVDEKVAYQRAFEGEYLSSKVLFTEDSRWHSDASVGHETDAEKAKELLEQAKADGFDGKIRFLGTTEPIAMVVKAQLESIGFTVDVTIQRNVTDVITLVMTGDYDIAAWAINIREFDPYPKLASTLHSEGSSVYGMYTDEEGDKLIDELKGADPDRAKEVMAEIEKRYYEQVPFLSLGPYTEATAWNSNVHGVEGTANSMVSFAKAWVKN
ncbi:ABC transporter substrate-binding protein [Enemella sp. A6]|uniref:ABC transporter substrate-binding protein n=1 Tax=Enemella sp. A6 TaxID=3440152 RepID=UPI003EB88FCF